MVEKSVDIDTMQKTALQKEEKRFDHTQIKEGFTDQVKVSRKRHRNLKLVQGDEASEESQDEELFQFEMEDADDKFGYKRKKKHLFNDEGVPIEPFNIRDDVREGIITQEGALKR